MAELTKLESKLAEVLGLAAAAKGATEKVRAMLDDNELALAGELTRMHDEARENEARCSEGAGEFDGKKTAILEKARETRREAIEMMETYLAGEDKALDGLEFMAMAEAGEVGPWGIVKKVTEQANMRSVAQLAEWALPIQERHLKVVLDCSLALASRENADEVAR